ncbi:hypothetical protein F5B18DRAFT_597635 [Nemania serpens]|nr:hypothetical protein F5B18DRAFT_597635 [Nemania serpens]
MFGALNIGGHQEARDKNRNEHEESQSFLTGDTDRSMKQPTARRCSVDTAGPWKISTAVLGLLLILLLSTELRHHVRPSYESGFNTDLQPAVSSIKLERRKFFGGIIVNESSEFELVLEPGGVRYTGRPTQELDDAWDRIVGNYLALTEAEAQSLQGPVAEERGRYYVVPHVRHSLHCVNYLRKVAYAKWYPTILTENKTTVPAFLMHADHCIETLRETLQCQADLTPVPHVWSKEKQMYLADTSLEHTCRDFGAIMKWQDARHG